MKSISVPVLCVLTLTACDRVRDIRIDIDRRLYLRREQAFHEDMEKIASDKQRAYRLDFILTPRWLSVLIDMQPQFRAMQNGQFDMSPWVRQSRVESTAIASAIFDPDKRTMIIIDSGPNIAVIESLLEPMRPNHYQTGLLS